MRYWFDHVQLVSRNPVDTAQFYETMFEAPMVGTRQLSNGRTAVELDLGGSRIFVISKQDGVEQVTTPSQLSHGVEHIGIATDNLDAAVEDLKAKGAKFTSDIWVARPGVRVTFLVGPEQVRIELVERE